MRKIVFFGGCLLVCSLCLNAQSVDSLTLMYPGTAGPVPGYDPMPDDAIINLAETGNELNLRANTTPDSDFGSVVFDLTGPTEISPNPKTENVPPWAMGGDTSGSYGTLDFQVGLHTLVVTPYPQNGGGGTAGQALTLRFTVVNEVIPTNDPPTVRLVAPVNGLSVPEPADFTLEAEATDTDGEVVKVEFFANGVKLGEDATPPYTLPWNDVAAGAYTLTAVATDNEGASSASAPVSVGVLGGSDSGDLSGELKKWHRVTLTFNGPLTSETAEVNPFRDYRLNVTFSHAASGKTDLVPGFFAANGHAADTHAGSGNRWRVHFAPDETGAWTYIASFRTGADVAVNEDPGAGAAASFDGASGSFEIGPTDKTGRDLRAKGRLQYVGGHHLRFAETGEYFLKCGTDAPENLLNFADFDDTPNVGNRQKTWAPHASDYDPDLAAEFTWDGGKGANLLGAIRYLSDEGLNAFSFLTFNVDGDDDNVFPHLINGSITDFEDGPNNQRWANDNVHHDRFDISKMAQWDRIFSYGETRGMYLHFKTQETENEMLMDNGDTGVERRLYYRELIARFGYHLALNWNLGEENGSLGDANQSTAQRQAMAQYFHDYDPYHHLIVIHNGKNPDDLLGDASALTGFSLQTSRTNFSLVHPRTKEWIDKSVDAGKPWVVACDEPGDASHALVPDSDTDPYDPDRAYARGNALWGQLLAGGAGLEWYFGYQHDHSDLTCQDFRSRDLFWDQCRYALEFFTVNSLPFWEMTNDNTLTTATDGYCLFKANEVYVVFQRDAEASQLDLTGASGSFTVAWFDPRIGGTLQSGSVMNVPGGAQVDLGTPPGSGSHDWVTLIRKANPEPPRVSISIVEGAIEIGWQPATSTLQHSPQVGGPWNDVEPPPVRPYVIEAPESQEYYRVR